MKKLGSLVFGVLALAACRQESTIESPETARIAGVSASTPTAGAFTAALRPTTGNKAEGEVRLTREGDQVTVTGEISGLTADAKHGFHLHEKGDCTGDGTAAGDHWNPTGMSHGDISADPRHAGDMGNIAADAS